MMSLVAIVIMTLVGELDESGREVGTGARGNMRAWDSYGF
jgi:hypothetical protein